MTQTSLDAFHADQTRLDDTDEHEDDDVDREIGYPEPYDSDGLFCPWCYADESEFVEQPPERAGELSCGACEAVLPVGAEWWESGETIVSHPENDPYKHYRKSDTNRS